MKKKINNKDKQIKYYIDIYLIIKKRFLRKGIKSIYIKYNQLAYKPKIGLIKVSNNIYLAQNMYMING